MNALKCLAIVLATLFLFAGCQKEMSFESGQPVVVATGSLKDSFGNCRAVTTNGNYVHGAALTESNFVVVQVNFSSPGSYSISTDTANGFSFAGSGITIDSGLQNITLKGIGTPLAGQITNFSVAFDTSVCNFSIEVSDSAIVPPVTSGDYFPTGDSSNWSYQLDTGDPTSDQNDTAYVAVLRTDKTIAGNTYRTFLSTGVDGTDTNYYRKGEGLYYTYGTFNNDFIYDSVYSSTEYIFLKDNVSVGTSWESPEISADHSLTTGKAKIKFTIEGKDIKTTIGTTTIDSVIKVKQEYMFAPASTNTYETLSTDYYYYAKNIGFIKAESIVPFPSTINIKRWEIHY